MCSFDGTLIKFNFLFSENFLKFVVMINDRTDHRVDRHNSNHYPHDHFRRILIFVHKNNKNNVTR